MGYPKHLLAPGEQIDLAMRPHWKALILPVLNLIVAVAVFGAAAGLTSGSTRKYAAIGVGALAVIDIIVFTVRPWIIWLNKNYIVTNKRLIIREGFIHREGRDMPLVKINDVSFKHNGLLDRILGCGTLVVESAGEHGQEQLEDIPHVESTQRELTNLISNVGPSGSAELAEPEEHEHHKK
ncbi:membrane-flanked domain protein [Catenulispora acidiphila DSM 44928]|uniref:Membrane-flanked domain protein n=1 Tax=Catenulispora acidiphila (strain DSM 44928 / JCM 14897 / NBRC 102108 / NRRL B-24433 / ID139908) TaxID=479433 RepID=C7Q0X5_CATAD|nr:PH domain-containing protein [Catenulispora acidiphila]ACU69753.1 membrane-flanked domain protein [Catenulispora acidiphila DSM 44928]